MSSVSQPRSGPIAFGSGAAIGMLGGLIGLGGAEFRLPLLIGLFRFAPLEAVILNKAMRFSSSLVSLCRSVPARFRSMKSLRIGRSLQISLPAVCWGHGLVPAGLPVCVRNPCYRVIAVLLVAIAIVLMAGHEFTAGQPLFVGTAQAIAGVVAGFAIGIVASLLGVAGGELLIPTLVLIFGADIKLAGSLSLAISLPTMLVGFTRYSQDKSFAVLGRNAMFVLIMASSSILARSLVERCWVSCQMRCCCPRLQPFF